MREERAEECRFAKSLSGLFFGRDTPKYWVAGGCFSSIVFGVRPKDYDIFSGDPQSVVGALAGQGFKKGYEDDRVCNLYKSGIKAQVVLGYKFQSMEETISEFDFTVACAAYDGKRFVCHDRFYQDVAQKTLVINKITKPLSTLSRAIRYARKGYSICPVGLGSIVRAIVDLNLDMNNPSSNEIEFYPDGITPRFRGLD